MINSEQLEEVVNYILKKMPYKPFLCLPMSAMLYAILRDDYNVEARLTTGNLRYRGEIIFKQDFKIEEANHIKILDWAGHAWVEFDGMICDLSIFRTIYSDQFSKSSKGALITQFGEGRGSLIGAKEELKSIGLFYEDMDVLKDETATGIIKGIEKLPIWN